MCLIVEGNLLFFILIPMSLAHHSGSISNQADDQTDFQQPNAITLIRHTYIFVVPSTRIRKGASAATFPFHLFLVLPMSAPDDPSNNCHCS